MSLFTAETQLRCFCLDDDIDDPLDIYTLRCGCSCHYHCIIQHIQVKLGDRKGEVIEGRIPCPFGTECASLQSEVALRITLQDLDDLAAYLIEHPNLTPLITCRPLTSYIVESYRSWLSSTPDGEATDENVTLVTVEIDPYLEATSKKCPGMH